MSVTLKQFLTDGRLKSHRTTSREIRDLLRVADRNFQDAAVEGISFDLRFTTAYQAVFQLATMVLGASGYRTTGQGHHWVTFTVLPELMGGEVQVVTDYFDQCRGKRNLSDYDRAGEISEEETVELLKEAKKFRGTVLNWLRRNHPGLAPQ